MTEEIDDRHKIEIQKTLLACIDPVADQDLLPSFQTSSIKYLGSNIIIIFTLVFHKSQEVLWPPIFHKIHPRKCYDHRLEPRPRKSYDSRLQPLLYFPCGSQEVLGFTLNKRSSNLGIVTFVSCHHKWITQMIEGLSNPIAAYTRVFNMGLASCGIS